MRNWIISWLVSALALFIITKLHVGIHVKDTTTLFIVVLVLGLVNSFIRPIIMFFAWPINCMTFGLFGFALNIILFWIVGNGLVPGFVVRDPLAAIIGSVGMGVLSGVFHFILKDRGQERG